MLSERFFIPGYWKREPMKRFFVLLMAALTAAFACGCTAQGAQDAQADWQKYQYEFYDTFDTVTIVVAYSRSQEEFDALCSTVHDTMLEAHKLFDIYHTYEGINNIKTINDNAGVQPVKVDARIITLLQQAKDWYDKSGGLLNVAEGAVLSIWHDYREAGIAEEAAAELPPQQMLEEAALHTDIENVIIDEAASTVYLADAEMSLDVGAMAKGCAVEEAADALIAQGYDSVLLSAGGNIRAIGAPRDGKRSLWSVGIAKPEIETDLVAQLQQELMDVAYVTNMSVVSSGGYERYYTVDGVAYHHLIDPVTLYPANYYKAVTVLTEDSGMADALSTVLFLMPPEQALSYAKGLDGVEALWVLPDDSLMYTEGAKTVMRDLGGAKNG